MSAVAVATVRPGPRTTPTPSASAPGRSRPAPRLLLPPRSEPTGLVGSARLAGAPEVRSVLAPVTAAAWAVVGRREPAAPTPDLPDPTRLCGAVVVAAVEALRSTRPLAQLARWVSPAVFESLSRAARPAPVEAPRGVVVRGLRVCRIDPSVAEATAVVHDGERVRAAAVRFEVHRGSWRATVLQIG